MTATVVTSVGLVIGPDGEPRMVVANAADPADNVSTLQAVTVQAPAAKPNAGANAKQRKVTQKMR